MFALLFVLTAVVELCVRGLASLLAFADVEERLLELVVFATLALLFVAPVVLGVTVDLLEVEVVFAPLPCVAATV